MWITDVKCSKIGFKPMKDSNQIPLGVSKNYFDWFKYSELRNRLTSVTKLTIFNYSPATQKKLKQQKF